MNGYKVVRALKTDISTVYIVLCLFRLYLFLFRLHTTSVVNRIATVLESNVADYIVRSSCWDICIGVLSISSNHGPCAGAPVGLEPEFLLQLQRLEHASY